MLELSDIQNADAETGWYLYTIAEKMPDTLEQNTKLLLRYVKKGEIINAAQLDKCISVLKNDKTDSISSEEFEKESGIGVVYSDEEIEAVVRDVLESKRDQILIERYQFKLLNCSPEVKSHFVYADSSLVKDKLTKVFEEIVGDMTTEDKEIEEMRNFVDG